MVYLTLVRKDDNSYISIVWEDGVCYHPVIGFLHNMSKGVFDSLCVPNEKYNVIRKEF